MVIVLWEEQIIGLDKLLNKTDRYLSFKEICSLIFHASKKMAANVTNVEWHIFYQEFLADYDKQNKTQWPQLSILRNDYYKRIEIISVEPFIKSENLLMLLLRLLYVENYKRPYIYEYMEYHKILGWKLDTGLTELADYTVGKLFDLLKKCMVHYNKIYDNDRHFEYQLAKAIIRQVDMIQHLER